MSTSEERCSCLEARRPLAVTTPTNQPGLTAIAYRIGRHADVKRRLLAGLSSEDRPALARLHARGDDDFTVALLDAFAAMADVLCFYQERIANESYLRTATERRSLLELARLTGYRPSPGLAAQVELVFSLEDAPGAPEPPVQETSIPVGTQVRSIPGPDETAQAFETVEAITARYEWTALEPLTTEPQTIGKGTREVWVEGLLLTVRAGQGLLLRVAPGASGGGAVDDVFRTIIAVETDREHGLTRLNLSAAIDRELDRATTDCFLLHQPAALFGHNAPNPCLLHLPTSGITYSEDNCEWIKDGIYAWTPLGDSLDLDAAYPGVAQDSLCVLIGTDPDHPQVGKIKSVCEVSLSHFALSGKVTRLTVSHVLSLEDLDRRNTSVFVQSELLKLSATKPKPSDSLVSGRNISVQGPLGTLPPAGQRGVLLEADGKGGWAPREMISIHSCDQEADSGVVTLNLAEPLEGTYTPAEVRINLNIARATHGETVQEILGNGDARIPNQRFVLKQRPLTHVPAGNPAGAESTLEVRVDDLLWSERLSFIGAGPEDRVYTASIDDDGTVILQFGDGIHGARLPSGQSNVRARYRKGTGLSGLVPAKQLSLLLSRPLGVKAVVNPVAAADAEDPEPPEMLRTTAPIRTLTLDRVVSLQDYEDYARTFPGIAKARADVHPTQPQSVLITVAGAKGVAIAKGSELAKRLAKALLTWGNPYLTVQVCPYRRVSFAMSARVQVQPDALPEQVEALVRKALLEAFCFERAMLGGRIWRSQVISLIHKVAGVDAVAIRRFERMTVPDFSGIVHFSHMVGPSVAGRPSMVWTGASSAHPTPISWQGSLGPLAKPITLRRFRSVRDFLAANPADPHQSLGAELLILQPASLRLEVVDGL